MFWEITEMTRETRGVGKERKHMYEHVFSCHNSELRDYCIEMVTKTKTGDKMCMVLQDSSEEQQDC